MPLRQYNKRIPGWVDRSIRHAVQAYPRNRYQHLSEFVVDLGKPNPSLMDQPMRPLIERNPLLGFQFIAAIELLIIIGLLIFPFK